MEILNERPPIYDAVCSIIGKPPDSAIFAYGDIIYNPSGASIPEDVIAHEEVHSRQQGGDPVDWWRKYLRDDDFRLDQEAEAYGVQYRWVHNNIPDRNESMRRLIYFAQTLASPMYGSLIDVESARRLIYDKSGL
jgi:hypothetical protein